MSKVVVMDHPLIEQKIGIIRRKETGTKDFRQNISEIAMLIGYEATKDLPLEEVEIETPICKTTVKQLKGKKLALVPILRAGLGMVDGMLSLIPAAKVGHIGLYRNPETLKPVEYYCKLPADCAEREVFVVDPMLATGGSSIAAIQLLKDKGFKSIVVPYQSLYLDMMQVPMAQRDINEKYQGGWGDNWVNSVETVYGVNPVASLSGKENFCLGVQGNMWTETCNDSVEVEYQLLPRMLALSETGWLPAAKKDFASFYMRLQKNRDILDAKGLTYATHYFDEPDLTEQEAAVAEAASLLENAKPGKVEIGRAHV